VSERRILAVDENAGADPIGVVVEQESLDLLARHARISIAFDIDHVLALSLAGEGGLEGIGLSEVAVEHPWRKDYDAVKDNSPLEWSQRFDLTRWGLLGAYENHERVGGAVIAYGSPDVWMLEGRDDLAVLWDLRVAPEARGHGVGAALFRAVEDWGRARGCRELKVETQNVNVAACRFYARMGCSLGAINTHAYVESPEEVQLLWYRSLAEQGGRQG
jgi:GNAT superfamily N-acetyltransferase